MSLSDESSEKQLLIQLADRDIISHETVLERFKEIPAVEKVRLGEGGDREVDRIPPKASPFHNANQKLDLEKMEKQTELNDKKKESQSPQPQKPMTNEEEDPYLGQMKNLENKG